jgi:malonate-semialdehyde dehydrogenase (acetylating) / methylmalonate-semialdehyde dehydrogenase
MGPSVTIMGMSEATETRAGEGSAPRRGEPRVLRNFVGGGWVEASTSETLDDVNPATGAVSALVPLSSEADVDAAVRAAREAFPAWRATPPQKRARAVMALREALWSNREELAQLVTEDMGKTLDDARGEVLRGIESTEAACGIPHLLKGENLEGVAAGVDVELVRQPVGVCAAITPFNFPAMIPLWFLPFAIACGNTFILKPSERDPRPSERITELLADIDEIPAGVVNLVHGAREAVSGILDHPDIDAISFVGQASTARMVAERSAATGKRVQALGGAKNSLVVMPDADLDVSVPAIMSSSFGAGGQRCLAGSVAVLVGDSRRQNEVLEALRAAASGLGVGPGDAEGVEVCPLIGPEARERIARALDQADEIILDGRRLGPEDGGPARTIIGPSIVETSDHESDLAREELFGPLLTIVRAGDLDEALDFVNGSRYGNAGSIFTSSGEAARNYRFGVEAGMIGVNVGVAAPVAWFPFSGWKDSIDGDLHANGSDAVEFFTRKKVVTSRWS